MDTLRGQILQGNIRALSKAITLAESTKVDHRMQAMELLSNLPARKSPSLRIGITGIPGVGKSTFIEGLGKEIISSGQKLAVLAIDPSSTKTGGSILGDKTRMEELSRNKNAFIRPSPSSGTLGGIAARTRESMLLCEAAGYDVIIIETVGVGQSETEVVNLSDVFLMLAMPGTGDELQGIKRGIMETADLIVINKSDGENLKLARKAKKQLEIALHHFPQAESGWNPKVKLASGLHHEGISEVWKTLVKIADRFKENGWFATERKRQQLIAFEKLAEINVYEQVMSTLGKEASLRELRETIEQQKQNEYSASLHLMSALKEVLKP